MLNLFNQVLAILVYFVKFWVTLFHFGSFCLNSLDCRTLGGTFNNFGELFYKFVELFEIYGEFFNIIGELLTNCILAILKNLVNFGEFSVILLHLDQLGSNNFGRFSQFWSILGDFASFSSIMFQ